MSKNIAIKVEKLSKQYRLGQVGTGTISHDINRWWHLMRGKEDPYLKIGENNDRTSKGNSEYVWALRDINFEVEKGEVLGIIGKNGAGKSTLLKLLSKVTSPTIGAIKTKGRIASLLEVGTGFHPEMTGRENIYMNGTIMGMSRQEISAKLDEIVEFAGVSRYLDTPVKRYSSGMTVRLGFSIAAHLEPEILIVDEVLAVGDAEFQKKAIGKMQDVSKGEGRTVLFVSHNMASIQTLCSRLIVLSEGGVIFNGDVNYGIKYYLNKDKKSDNLGYKLIESNSNGFSFIDITLKNPENEVTHLFYYEQSIHILFKYKIKKPLSSFVLLFRLTNEEGITIFTSWDKDDKMERIEDVDSIYCASLKLPPLFLKKGLYFITIAAHTPNVEIIDVQEDVLSFEIGDLGYLVNSSRKGVIQPKLKWEIELDNRV